ncbi:hypothetical protein RND71_033923 [Anisodus tanguticus]|uniref:Uncharacterized protein n=1 Tax=Anisodus tanguticus TaxID=243964 RepID=A0AAE1RAA1_9SOLA|nr:hypothetical protein RND71_033923 [Anisodus tanguticus]
MKGKRQRSAEGREQEEEIGGGKGYMSCQLRGLFSLGGWINRRQGKAICRKEEQPEVARCNSKEPYLTDLVIFQNFLYLVIYRSVHVYRSEARKEEMEEREYLLHKASNFEETRCAPVITLYKFDVSAQFVGNLNGVWKCMFVYDSDRDQSTSVDASPEWLSIVEYVFLFSV